MATHIPKLSKLLCYGEVDKFYQQLPGCVTSYEKYAKDFECGHWILFAQKCRMSDDPSCYVVKEIVRGRTCNGILQGLTDRLIPDMRSEKQGESRPEPYEGWKCGDIYQPPCDPEENSGIDDLLNRNTYRWWFIRIYDHEVGSWDPYLFDDPDSPNPIPPRCVSCPSDPPPKEKIRVTCGCGNCPDLINMGETESEVEAERLRQQCLALLLTHPNRDQCGCDPAPLPPEPPEEPISPPVSWGGGDSSGRPSFPSWGQEEEEVNWLPPSSNWGNGGRNYGNGSGWNDEGGGGGGGGDGSGPPTGTCNVTIRTRTCDLLEGLDLRMVDENMQIPTKRQNFNYGSNELVGLTDATYFKTRRFA